MFSGNAITHRVTRLQPDTKYIFRVAAISSSGQGDWSDRVIVMTTPAPPMFPKGFVVTQLSSDMLEMAWQAVDCPYPVMYETQYRVAKRNQEYQQVDSGTM